MAKIFKIFALTVTILLIVGFLFRVKSIEVSQDQSCLTQERAELDYKLKNKIIFFVNIPKLQEDLKKDYACIESLEITKKYPSKVFVSLKTQQAIAKVEGTNFYLDIDGKWLENTDGDNLAVVFLPEGINTQDKKQITNGQVLFALKLVQNLRKSDFNPTTVRFTSPTDIVIYNTSGVYAIFTSNKELNSQVDSLQYILGKAKIDATKIQNLDLRFEKPVIVNKKI